MIRNTFICFFLLIACNSAHGQVTTFQRTYGYGEGMGIEQTPDQGYIVSGLTYPSVSSFDVKPTLMKLDYAGEIQWAKTYDEFSWACYAHNFCLTQDNGVLFLLTGYDTATTASYDVVLVKTDQFGVVQWAKKYGGWMMEIAKKIIKLSDGNYLITGISDSFSPNGDRDILLIKVDANGNLIWSNTYGSSGYQSAFSVIETSNEDLVVVGGSQTGNTFQGYMIKTDKNGNILLNLIIGTDINIDALYDVVEDLDLGYTAVGIMDIGLQFDIYILKVDKDFNVLNEKTFGSSTYEEPFGIRHTLDGGKIVMIEPESFAINPPRSEMGLMKLDSTWNIEWAKVYGDGNGGWPDAFITTSDGGFAMVGRRINGFELQFVKTDSLGNTDCEVRNISFLNSSIPTAVTSDCVVRQGCTQNSFVLQGISLIINDDTTICSTIGPPPPPVPVATTCTYFIPTAFSPDVNSNNDYFRVTSNCIKEMKLLVYDRWGEQVFKSQEQSQWWDGTYKGKALDQGVFMYYFRATLNSGEVVDQKGNITLIR